MKAISSNYQNIKEELAKYRGDRTFIDVRATNGIGNITIRDKGQLDKVKVQLYSSDVNNGEILEIAVYNNKISKDLKDFLESSELITFSLENIVRALLVFNIRVNIEHDVKTMHAISTGKQVRYKEVIDTKGMAGLYESLKDIIDNGEYRKLIGIQKLLAYGDYFGLAQDISDQEVQDIRKREIAEVQAIRNKWRDKYNCDITQESEIKETLTRLTGIKLKSCSIQALTELYSKAPDWYTEIIELKRHKKLSARALGMGNYSKQFRMSVQDCKRVQLWGDIRTDWFKDIIRTNSKKYYYISIEPVLIDWKLLEKLNGGEDFGDIDYHALIASKLFSKDIKDVTHKDRYKAKVYNFVRLLYANRRNREEEPHKTLYARMNNASNLIEQKYLNEFDEFTRIVPIYESAPIKPYLDKFQVKGLYGVYTRLEESRYLPFSMSIHSVSHDEVVFKVSNKINPYRAMKILIDAFDTTEQIGVRLYDNLGIGNSYSELKYNSRFFAEENGVRVIKRTIPADFVEEQFKRIEKEELRDIVREVMTEANKYNK